MARSIEADRASMSRKRSCCKAYEKEGRKWSVRHARVKGSTYEDGKWCGAWRSLAHQGAQEYGRYGMAGNHRITIRRSKNGLGGQKPLRRHPAMEGENA